MALFVALILAPFLFSVALIFSTNMGDVLNGKALVPRVPRRSKDRMFYWNSERSYSGLPVSRLTKLFDLNARPLTRSLRKSSKETIRPLGKYWQGMLNSLKGPFGARRQTAKERRDSELPTRAIANYPEQRFTLRNGILVIRQHPGVSPPSCSAASEHNHSPRSNPHSHVCSVCFIVDSLAQPLETPLPPANFVFQITINIPLDQFCPIRNVSSGEVT